MSVSFQTRRRGTVKRRFLLTYGQLIGKIELIIGGDGDFVLSSVVGGYTIAEMLKLHIINKEVFG